MAEWMGYLVIACGDRLYLADSNQMFTHRNGVTNYEWYFAEGVVGYAMSWGSDVVDLYGKTFLDEMAESITEDFLIGDCLASEAVVRSDFGYYGRIVIPNEPITVYARNLIKVSVYGGENEDFKGYISGVYDEWESWDKFKFIPCKVLPAKVPRRTFKITALCSVDDVLYFGTEGGCVYCFNTDRRGADGKIPEADYNFGEVRYESSCALRSDDCDIPGYTKKTSRGSFVLRTKPFRHSRIKARGRADRGELSVWRELTASTSSELDFSATAFDALSFAGGDAKICIVRESFRRWYEKQLYFYTEGYCEPFGIYSASFRYTVQGKLKI